MRLAIFSSKQPIGGEETGMWALACALGGDVVEYSETWAKLRWKHWQLSKLLRWAGNAYYGTTWNALVPFWGEAKLKRMVPKPRVGRIYHFMFAEYASPRRHGPLYARSNRYVGTFHATPSRQHEVLSPRFDLSVFDAIVVVASTQIPFFIQRGVPAERIHCIPHHINRALFRPLTEREPRRQAPLRALMVGSTQRDHGFTVQIVQALPPGLIDLRVRVPNWQKEPYEGVPGVTLLPRLSTDELVREYQNADLLLMPLMDATANNAVLEAMSCGTPVMVNDVGGIPEYVDRECNYVFKGKRLEEWVAKITSLYHEPAPLDALRPLVRKSTERFEVTRVIQQYRTLYKSIE